MAGMKSLRRKWLCEGGTTIAMRSAALLLGILVSAPTLAGTPADTMGDFPVALRRARPVEKIDDAVVYTVHNTVHTPYDMELFRKVGSDALVRAWFKWHNAADYNTSLPASE